MSENNELSNVFPNAAQFDTMNILLASIASKEGGIKFNSFSDIQKIVRLGLAKQAFAVGDQISCYRESSLTATVGTGSHITGATVNEVTFINKIGTTGVEEYEFVYDGSAWHLGEHAVILSEYGITITGTAQANDKVIIIESASELVFDVIGIDVETPSDSSKTHSLSLALHDCLSGLQFDAPEALYYAESGLAAGNYGFTFDGTKYTFTLTNAVPTGGQLVFDRGAATIKVYASSASTTATETASTTSVGSFPDGTTDLGTANGQTTNMNHFHRCLYGSNNWMQSAMRQWLNSDKAAGSVWTPKTKFDRPPSWASNTKGFLYGLDPDLRSVLGKVKKVTVNNTVTDGGGSTTNDELVFLLSKSEVNGTNENSIKEGDPYPYFAAMSSSRTDNALAGRIKYRSGSAQYWWLRSPNSGDSYFVRSVYTAGNINNGLAYGSFGVVPACVII